MTIVLTVSLTQGSICLAVVSLSILKRGSGHQVFALGMFSLLTANPNTARLNKGDGHNFCISRLLWRELLFACQNMIS